MPIQPPPPPAVSPGTGSLPGHAVRSGRARLAPSVAIALAFSPALLTVPATRAVSAEEGTGLTSFGETIEVRLINIEAVVTRGGERVEGLGPEDFVLEVDGEQVPIEMFTEVRGGRAVSGRPELGSATLPAFPAGEVVPTWFLVFVDDYFSLPNRRDQVLRRLRQQLDRLGPEDRMALVAYDGQRLELLSSWTGSERELERALRRAQQRPAYGLQRRSEWRRASGGRNYRVRPSPGRSFSSIGFSGAARTTEDPYAPGRELASRVSRVASAAAAALRGFAAPRGRKVMLLLSGGLPAPGDGVLDLGSAAGELDRLQDFEDLRRLMSPLLESANRLGYTLYPVDLGEVAPGLLGADVATAFQAGLARAWAEQQDELTEDVLHHLARSTGGRAFLDAGRFQSLELAVRDTRSYYWLGFTPSWQGDDGVRQVRLGTVGKGLDVRSRGSYADLSRAALATMQVESAHLFDLPVPSARSFGAEVGRPETSGWGKVEVPITLRVPLDGVTLVADPQNPSARLARLELRIAATDDRGYEAESPLTSVVFRLDGPPEPGQAVAWATRLELRRRAHRLLLVLHDPMGDAMWAHRLELSP